MSLSITELQTASETTWLPFICFLFWEQLKRSVGFGCPLLQDYSLLNLLAAFSITLSYVSLPSCSLASTMADRSGGDGGRHRKKDLQSQKIAGETELSTLKGGKMASRGLVTEYNCSKLSSLQHFTRSLSTFWPFSYLTPRPINCHWTLRNNADRNLVLLFTVQIQNKKQKLNRQKKRGRRGGWA